MMETEEGARTWLAAQFDVSRETMGRLDAFAALLREENGRQNLVARSTLSTLWVRHIADSAQLLFQAPAPTCSWLDLGSGAGFPGLIVALLHRGHVTLVESRKLRVAFLERAAALLEVKVTLHGTALERVKPAPFDVISARAFAKTPHTLTIAHPFSTEKTRWVLPKGASAQSELEAARASWHGEFRLVPSLTDPHASIIIAEGMRPRRQREPQ